MRGGFIFIIKREEGSAIATAAHPSQHATSVLRLTNLQQTLWQLRLPVLTVGVVDRHKKYAKFAMLWNTIRWLLVGMGALIALECCGRHWTRVGFIAGAAALLAGFFAWLVSASDLQWTTADYPAYRKLYDVPAHVSAVADALVRSGVEETSIGVEYLKDDPILFVEEDGERHNLVIW